MVLTGSTRRKVYKNKYKLSCRRPAQHINEEDTFKHLNCFLLNLFVACIENRLFDRLLIKKEGFNLISTSTLFNAFHLFLLNHT